MWHWLDVFERGGVWQGIVAEFLEVGPQVLVVWMAISYLPSTARRPGRRSIEPPGPNDDGNHREPVDVEKDEAGQYADERSAPSSWLQDSRIAGHSRRWRSHPICIICMFTPSSGAA